MELQYSEIVNEQPIQGLEGHVAGFLQDRKDEFSVLMEKQAQGDREYMKTLVHTWKGFCQPYGFSGLGQLAVEIDSALKDDLSANVDALLLQVEQYLKLKSKAINDGA